jgi:hypothetical protein
MTVVSKASIRYVVGGLVIGGFWYLNRGRAPWDEAVRTFVVFALAMMAMRARLKSVEVHLAPLLAAKAGLLVIAALVQGGLEHSMSDPGLVVAFGLGLAVALLGPLGHHRFFTRKTPVPTTVGSVR